MDPTLRSAWRRVMLLWRPMAGWTLLVWAAVAAFLAPLSSWLLGLRFLRGRRPVVGNEDLVAWLVTPSGVSWLTLAGGLAVAGAVVRYAGLYRIVTDRLEGRQATVRRTALELAPGVPALLRLCLAAAAATAAALVPLVAGLVAIRAGFLGAHDINYYLAERPPAWWAALATAGLWTAAWLSATAWLAARTLPALPAHVDGHRPLRVAVRRSWRRTRGRAGRLLRLLGTATALWLTGRIAVDGLMVWTVSAGFDVVAGATSSLRLLVLAAGLLGAVGLAVDAALAFLGFAFLATVLTKFYHEDTELHAEAPPLPELEEIGIRAASGAARWLRPARLLPLALGLVATSVTASGILLERIPEPRAALVVAHRAGPPPAPENTLAALERAIEAGADMAEIDVQRTRDGVPVVVHDADLMRVAGARRRIRLTDYAELADVVQRPDDGTPPSERRVATLGELLDRARDRIGLAIELKRYGDDPGLVDAVVAEVRSRGMEDQVLLMSLDLSTVQRAVRAAPDIQVGYVVAAAVGDVSRLPVDLLAVSRSRATPRLLSEAARRGLEVHAWTLNRADDMAELILRGVDGIITDDPALAVRVNSELRTLPAAARLLLRSRSVLPTEAP